VDRTTAATGEEELGRVQLHIVLEVWGNDLEVVVDEVLEEEGDACLIVHVAMPSYSWVYSRHWAIGSGGMRLLAIFVVEDEVEGWDG
jgi:hypothetical protein